MRYAIAAVPVAFTSALLLALSPASGQNRAAPDAAAQADAGKRLAALMSSAAMPIASTADAQRAFIDEYCADCHNDGTLAGGLDLTAPSTHDLGADAEIWEKVARKIRGGMMPPAGSFRPPTSDAMTFAESIEQGLDSYAASHVPPDVVTVARLNRVEYANAIRDVLLVDVDAATTLPPDDSIHGFDNMSEMLGTSPALVQSYISAALRISRQAVGDVNMAPVRVAMRPTGRTDNLPLGATAAVVGEYFFPVDGEYEITVSGPLSGTTVPPGGLNVVTSRPAAQTTGRIAAVVVDGKPLNAPNLQTFTVTLPTGTHTIGAALVELGRPEGVDGIYPTGGGGRGGGGGGAGGGVTVTVNGPVKVTGLGPTPSRDRLLVCQPKAASEDEACARKIFAQLATRAFRRPVPANDPALTPIMAAYQAGRAQGDFNVGIRQGVARVLVDPRFLFRLESEPANVRPGQAYKISDVELASRLSFFLWSSVPDDQLLQVAAAGRLSRPAELEKQVTRMLADPKADALSKNFAGQWLMLRNLDTVTPDDPDFDAALRTAMRQETEMLFKSVLDEGRSVLTLLDADYTFVNARLARHYGMTGVQGAEMRRVSLPSDSPRRGLLGQASILTVTSSADRTSPVSRGKWVLEQVLGLPVPQPPPGVETNLEVSVHIDGPTTLRTRLEAHRESPACRSCHAVMDPIGFAMEPFDKVGKLRTEDSGLPINANGVMVDGTPLDGPASLRSALVADSNLFVTSVSEKLMTYALGRPVEYYDRPAVREIVRQGAQDNYKLTTLIMRIVESPTFQQGVKPAAGPAVVASAE